MIVPDTESTRRFTEEFVTENADIAAARLTSIELGIDAIAPSVGSQIAVIAAAAAPSNIIEIGTGVGVSGLWLLLGASTATLTTIDSEPDHHQEARRIFGDAGIQANRLRLITGRALDVLPRMNERSYDIVMIDADPGHVIEYVEHGLRLVRAGGAVLVAHALWRGRVADPTARDETTAQYRTLIREIAQSDAVISALSPVGDGLLQLIKASD